MVDSSRQFREYFGVGALDVLSVWRGHIERALLRSGQQNTWEDVVRGVTSGHMQVWPGKRSCLVTQITVYPKHRALRVFLAAGNSREILSMTDDVAEWARWQGCAVAEFEGRLGWEKPLSAAGWKRRFVVMQLELGEDNGR